MKLFQKIFADEWTKMLMFTIGMTAMAIAQVAFWPFINKLVPSLLKATPEVLRWAVEGMMEEKFVFFTGVNQFSKNIGMFGAFLAIMLGASSIARERENGTLEILLSKPISRFRVLAEKYLFNLAGLAIPVILSSFITWPSGLFFNENISPINLVLASIYSLAIIGILYSAAFCLGTFIDDQIKTLSVGLIIMLIMFLLSIFKETKPFSLYYWIGTDFTVPLMSFGTFPLTIFAIMLVLNALIFAVAWLRFKTLNI